MARKARAPQPKTVRAVFPNAGVAAAYRRRLNAEIEAMHASVMWWIGASYRANPPAAMAQDGLSANALSRALNRLTKRWVKRFSDAAEGWAAKFANGIVKRSDVGMKSAFKDAGWTVEFDMGGAARDIIAATVKENVGLIKSIPEQYLGRVQSMVMQSVQTGRDVGGLAKQIEAQFGVTKRRAQFIARDQNEKATAAIQRARQLDLGIKQAVWLHSGGGKHPRPSHVAFSGKVFNVADGVILDGERVWPGTAPNCRCCSKPILPDLKAS